jgi:hypothetical protein
MKLTIEVFIILAYFVAEWLFSPVYVQPNLNEYIIPPGVTVAINKMGPGYQYKFHPDGILKVNKEDGQGWLRLSYDKKLE